MKDIRPKLINLLREGYCSPQIARIAHTMQEPSTTIHYNIRKLESEGAIRTYKAVLDHQKIGEGFCAFVLIALSPYLYELDPDKLASTLAKHREVESVDIVSGDWELILKVRTKDQDEYYNFLKNVISRERGVKRTCSIISLKQVKTEFVETH